MITFNRYLAINGVIISLKGESKGDDCFRLTIQTREIEGKNVMQIMFCAKG